jgi:hypothetical protein
MAKFTKYPPRFGGQHRRPWSNYKRPEQTDPAPPPVERRKPIKIEGTPGLWIILQRVTDPNTGWVKTTSAMQTPTGVIINSSLRNGTTTATDSMMKETGCKIVLRADGFGELVKA